MFNSTATQVCPPSRVGRVIPSRADKNVEIDRFQSVNTDIA
jgi:hypothetical protein